MHPEPLVLLMNDLMALFIIKLCFCQIITVSGLSVTLFKNLSLMHSLCDSLLKEIFLVHVC